MAFFLKVILAVHPPTATNNLTLLIEYKVPVVYKGSQVQGIEPTTKWYKFIYKPRTTPMERDVRITCSGLDLHCVMVYLPDGIRVPLLNRTRDASPIPSTGWMVASFPEVTNNGSICSPSMPFSCQPPSLEKNAMSVSLKWDTGIKDCKKGRPTWPSDPMLALAFAATARRDTKR